MTDLHPAKPQPYDPPSPAAAVWATPQSPDMIGSLASYMYAQVTWGHEPHPSQVSEIDLAAWQLVRERWEQATLNLLQMLDRVGHIALEFQQEQTGET
jgi:hypothetical protein